MKNIFFPLILCLSFNLYGQSVLSENKNSGNKIEAVKQCNLETKDLPLFHGVRFGMPYEEVSEIYPEIKDDAHFHKIFDTEKKGLFMIEGAKISNPELKKDVEQLSLNFFENELQVIAVVYDSNKWTSIYDSIGYLSGVFQVDNNYWSVFNNQSAEMKCVDFNVYTNHLIYGKTPAQNSMSIHKIQK